MAELSCNFPLEMLHPWLTAYNYAVSRGFSPLQASYYAKLMLNFWYYNNSYALNKLRFNTAYKFNI